MSGRLTAIIATTVLMINLPLHAQPSINDQTADTLGKALAGFLSLASWGAVRTDTVHMDVKPDGDAYRFRLPLRGLDDPVTARATPDARGVWTLDSLTLPPQGTFSLPALEQHPLDQHPLDQHPLGQTDFTIGHQAITGQIDPALIQPSRFTANFGDVQVTSRQGTAHTRQSIGRYDLTGQLVPEADGRVGLTLSGSAADWNSDSRMDDGQSVLVTARRMNTAMAVQGLARDQAAHLHASVQALIAADTDAVRQETLSGMVNDMSGLLQRFDMHETLDDVTVSLGRDRGGSASHLLFTFSGGTTADRLDGGMDIAADDLMVSAMPAAYASYVPRHVALRNVIRGVDPADMRTFLHTVLASAGRPETLLPAVQHLLADPNAVVAIDPFSLDSGPLTLTGTARLVTGQTGTLAGHIHLSATGMDALMAQVQAQPALAQIMPVLFLAKGMAKPRANTLVWDIDVGDGPVRINGTAFGQPAGKTR